MAGQGSMSVMGIYQQLSESLLYKIDRSLLGAAMYCRSQVTTFDPFYHRSKHDRRRQKLRFWFIDPPAHRPTVAHDFVHCHFCGVFGRGWFLSAQCKAAAASNNAETQRRAGLYFRGCHGMATGALRPYGCA